MRTLEVTPQHRIVSIPVVNGWVRCPFQGLGRRVTVSDCSECDRRRRLVTDYHGRTWVHCSA